MWIILVYLLTIFIFPRIIIPYLGFIKSPLPETLPQELEDVINELNKRCLTEKEYLKEVYDFITKHYYGSRFMTFSRFWYLFKNPFAFNSGFMPCTLQNHILRTMLIKSGRFSERDIRMCVVPFNLIIHQFLKVRINSSWINIDPWSKAIGVPFGKNSFLFG